MDHNEYKQGSDSFDFVERELSRSLRASCRVMAAGSTNQDIIADIKKMSDAIDIVSDAHLKFLERNSS